MDAATLNCPNCGAPSRDAATQCSHCGARLATTACPSCFGLVFTGSRHCPHCGTQITRVETPGAKPRGCPRCKVNLNAATLGNVNLHECPKCAGLWLDAETFNALCADRENQATVVGDAPLPPANPADFKLDAVRYVGCCVCGTLMNRINFAGCSGVIVDICKPHGIWFDREELRRIIAFIRGGGLDKARESERQKLEAGRRRLDAARERTAHGLPPNRGGPDVDPTLFDLTDVAGYLGRAIWRLLS